MISQTNIERLCTEGVLYDAAFVQRFGMLSGHWERNNWFQREASLRHDMVCLLLCNTEPMQLSLDDNIIDALEPPSKKRKIEEIMSLPSTSSSGTGESSKSYGSDLTPSDFGDMGEDSKYRYVLLEGRSNLISIQNKICKNYGYEVLTRQYDIFDRKEGKFIEVKVTKDYSNSLREYNSYFDNPSVTSLFHINPETMQSHLINKKDELPGKAKAVSFLMRRLSELRVSLGIQDADIEYTENMIGEIFSSERFNKMVDDWVTTFWSLRKLELKDSDKDPIFKKKIEPLEEKKLKSLIEDTTKRDAEFIKFKGKLLPHVFTSHILTESDEDSQMMDEILNCSFPHDPDMDWIASRWKANRDTFCFIKDNEYKESPESLLLDLGISQKGTIRFDNHPDLKQKEFQGDPKLRYSGWISNLLRDSSEMDGDALNYFAHLRKEEQSTVHPMGNLSQKAANKIFSNFSETELAAYCSKVRNFYSRLGGAYLKRNAISNKRPAVVIFPLYSSGDRDGVKIRRVYGFAIRGPQHAKKATDRIPFITYELMGESSRSRKYQEFIKKPFFFSDSKGRRWCKRVNSILKQDPSYLTFVVNSTYLTANMIGELTIGNPSFFCSTKIEEKTLNFIDTYRNWFLERMAESVYMAVMGNSQEEGTLAAVRKIFMLKLNWSRGKAAWGSDLEGFADSLNECLGDQPLALYFAKQFRDILDD